MYRVLRDEPPVPAIVVAVPHRHQARVAIGLAAVAAAELEGGRAAISRRCECAEGGGVLVEALASIGGVECPQVALLVVAVEGAGPAAPLGQSGGVDRRTVAEDGCAGGCAVAEGDVSPGAVGLCHAQAEAVIGKGIGDAGRGDTREPIFVILPFPI